MSVNEFIAESALTISGRYRILDAYENEYGAESDRAIEAKRNLIVLKEKLK